MDSVPGRGKSISDTGLQTMKKRIKKYLTELFTEIINKTMNEIKSPQEVQTEKAIARIKTFLKDCKLRNGRAYKVSEIELNGNGQPITLKGEVEIQDGVTTPMLWSIDGRAITHDDIGFHLIHTVSL